MIDLMTLTIIVAFFLATVLEGIWLFWVYRKVPVKLFTGTKKGEIILMQIAEDNKVSFDKAKIEAGMAVRETKKEASSYLMTPFSTLIEPKSKTTIGITYSNYGVMVSPEMHAAANSIKDSGIRDNEQLEMVNGALETSKETVEYEITSPDEERKIEGKTICLSYFYDFLHKIIRSDIIESRIQRRTAMEIKKRKKTSVDAITILLILVGAGIMIYILSLVMNSGGISVSECKEMCGSIGTAVKSGTSIS